MRSRRQPMSAPLRAEAARGVASGAGAGDDAPATALYRRIGARIVPFLFVCYIVSILDRSNIGFAQLQMRQDLGLTDAMYSLGAVVPGIAAPRRSCLRASRAARASFRPLWRSTRATAPCSNDAFRFQPQAVAVEAHRAVSRSSTPIVSTLILGFMWRPSRSDKGSAPLTPAASRRPTRSIRCPARGRCARRRAGSSPRRR